MRVSDKAAVERILKAVADPEVTLLLMLMRKTSKSAQSLSSESGIPQSTVYRKLDELKEAGLVMTEHSSVTGGKRIDFLVVTFSEIKLVLHEGFMTVDIVPTNENVNMRWLDLFRGG
jgi:DNA-binding transcriptional ArsR family regulator